MSQRRSGGYAQKPNSRQHQGIHQHGQEVLAATSACICGPCSAIEGANMKADGFAPAAIEAVRSSYTKLWSEI